MTAPDPDPPTFSALALDGAGGARPLEDPAALAPPGECRWVILRTDDPAGVAWLTERSGLPALAVDSLLAEETRPHWAPLDGGHIVILRGVNLSPGAEPDDMVSLRAWLEPGRLIIVHVRRVYALGDVRDALALGRGPPDPARVLLALAEQLVTRMGPVIDQLDDRADVLEDAVLAEDRESARLTSELSDLRRTVIRLRRYLVPQREALLELAEDNGLALDKPGRRSLAAIANRMSRYVELLDAVREHAAVTQDQVQNRTLHRANETANFVTVIAAFFLPLGFVTGLLGINVGGIPGAGWSLGFGSVCAILAILAVLEIWLLRRLGWLRRRR